MQVELVINYVVFRKPKLYDAESNREDGYATQRDAIAAISAYRSATRSVCSKG